MASNISDERNELQEDEEKLQTALLETGDHWDDDYYSEEDEEDEDQLLIDLDYENEASEQTGHSSTPSYVGSVSQSHSCIAPDDGSSEAFPRPNLQLPSQIDVVEHRADPQKTLDLNRILQSILEEHINDIKEALDENKEKQAKLEEDVSDYRIKSEKKGVYSGPFRAPYFRHVNSYPPANEDVLQKKKSGDYGITTVDSIKDLRQFTKTAKVMLRETVLEDCLGQILKPIITKLEMEIPKRDKITEELNVMSFKLDNETKHLEELQGSSANSDRNRMIKEVKKTIEELNKVMEEKRKTVDGYKEEIAKLEEEIKKKKNIPEDELLKTVDPEKVDWMKIAKHNFGGHSTWLDCQKAWENLVSPSVNKKVWTKEEEKMLVELVAKSPTGDWKEIAKALGSCRTPFQCFSRYQQRFNSGLKPRPWTEEENARLVKVTNNVKDSVGFFSWSKVSTLMNSRSPVECMYRFTKVDPSQARGRWTELEDTKLIAAVQMIGPCWSKVSKFIATRNMVQCRDRYLNCLAPNINFSHFTYDEDVKLLKLYKTVGSAWAKMMPELNGRTDGMLLNRYRQLQKWKQQNEWFNRQTEATKKMLLGKSLTVAERQRFQARAMDYMKVQLGVVAEDYKRQELDKLNGVDPDIIPHRPPRHLRCYSVGGPSANGSLNKWSMKLDVQKRLSENLHRLLENEALASKKKGKCPAKLPEEVRDQIMEQSVEETLRGNKQVKSVFRTKGQVKKLEAALNKVFLNAGTVSVQELLQSSVMEKKRAKKCERSVFVESELKSILRKRGRTLSKLGRSRRFFEKDTRPLHIIEEELNELDLSVPLMLAKNLGTDINYLSNAVRLQCLEFKEELSNQPSYENDVDFQDKEAETQEAIRKLSQRTDIGNVYRQQRLSSLKGKLKTLRKIHKEKLYLKSRVVENKISSFQDDLDYLETLIDEKLEKDVNKNLSLMACNSSLEMEFDAEIMETSPVSLTTSSTFIHPSSMTTSVPLSKTPLQSTTHQIITPAPLSSRGKPSESTENSEFAVPLRPLKRKWTRNNSRYSSNNFLKNEPTNKQFKTLSKEDIANERRKIPDVKKTIFIKLPYLPPSLSTLLGLRALFLIKSDLIKKAGNMYCPEHHGSAYQLNKDVGDEVHVVEGSSSEGCQGGIQVEDSGSWFLNTNSQQLTEQASSFQGYGVRPRGRMHRGPADSSYATAQLLESLLYPQIQKDQQDLVPFERETFIFPLEERGGHLPELINKSSHDIEADLKPIICEQREAPVCPSSEQKNSNYEIVMAFSGSSLVECSSVKEIEKQIFRNPLSRSKSPFAEQNRICIVPGSVISTNDSVTATDSTISVSGCVDDDRSRGASTDFENMLVQKKTTSRSDVDVHSLHTANQAEDSDDDDGVVAVIHIDNAEDDGDDDNSTPTIVNICSSQSSNQTSTSNGDEIVMFSGKSMSSNFSITPPERNLHQELSCLKLPESRVRSILSNRVLQNRKSRIVLVGVDVDSKRIVHFKPEQDRFTAFEALPTSVAEDSTRYRSIVQTLQSEKKKKEKEIPDCMRSLRQTDEYKLLLTRFRALFMWPVLMSTVKPNPLGEDSLPYSILHQQSLDRENKKKRRFRGKQSVTKKEHLRMIRRNSLAVRKKKMDEKLASRSSREMERIDENSDEMVDAGDHTPVSLQEQDAGPPNAEDHRPQGINGDVTTGGEASVVVEDNEEKVEEAPHKARRGRPKGSKNHSYRIVPRERPKRTVRKVFDENLAAEIVREPVKSLPQWWKDAVLAAMLAKKAMADDGDEDSEVDIEDDVDFIDKGNYSDDEWYQELREQEMTIAKHKTLEQICNSDPVMSTSQDIMAEESTTHE